MKFTREQFYYLQEDGGKFHLDELPFNEMSEDKMYLLFNALPQHIQGEVVCWGFGDTVVSEKIAEFLLDNQLGLSFDEYYNQYNELNENKTDINFFKLV